MNRAAAVVVAIGIGAFVAAMLPGAAEADPAPPPGLEVPEAGEVGDGVVDAEPAQIGRKSCPRGQASCRGVCRDVRRDEENCGKCGVQCDPGEICTGGTCAVSCQRGLTNCRGKCRDLQRDIEHCGGCDRQCDAGEACSAGQCAVSCQVGLSNCQGKCRDLQRDDQNCGGCGIQCGPQQDCSGGRCVRVCR